jgi:hypothetical protein
MINLAVSTTDLIKGMPDWHLTINDNFHNVVSEMSNSTSVNASLVDSTGYGVISGLTTYAQASPNMTVGVLNGIVHMSDGTRVTSTGMSSISISPADTTNTRIDIIYIKSDGTINYLAGTALPSPLAPSVSSGGFLLSQINVPANSASISATNITDKRKMANTTESIANKIGDLSTLTTIDKTSTVNAIKENTQNISKLKSPQRAKYYIPDTTIAPSTWTKLSFGTKVFDSNYFISTDFTKLTIKEAGTYIINAYIMFSSGNGTLRNVYLAKNGSAIAYQTGNINISTSYRTQLTTISHFDANDILEIYAFQDSGASLTITMANGEGSGISIVKIGEYL